ncbi:type II secretion system protein [Halorhodospira sp. M38]|uniref:type II secretion system protein n=1 Tax=Halorhodospira sp. M38 TaxID=2899130 RepID=UPI0030841244
MQVTVDRVQRRDTCLRKATGPRGSGFVASAAQRGLTLIEMIVTIVVLGIAMAALASFYPLLAQLPDAEEAERAARNAESCAELIIAASRDYYDEDQKIFLFQPSKIQVGGELGPANGNDNGIYIGEDLWDRFCSGNSLVEVSASEHGKNKLIIEIGYDSDSTVSGLDPLYLGFD